MTADIPYLDAEDVFAAVGWPEAVAAVEDALRGGLDPTSALPRTVHDLSAGQLLLMPAESGERVGVKVSTLAPGNTRRGLPRIQAVYLLLDATTLAPVALLDGTALTTLRTPAVSAVAVDHLARGGAGRLVVFGSGPQAWGHVAAVRTVRPLVNVTVVGRDPARAKSLADRVVDSGLSAQPGGPGAVAEADIVVCATSAREPLFDGSTLRDDACVVAIGSHEPTARELDAATFSRASRIVVEDVATAMREAGDVIAAVHEGAITQDALTGLGDALDHPPARGLSVFKGVGAGWEDLVVAQRAYRR